MLWTAREQVPAKFGPPGAESGPVLNAAGNPIPNWSPTRYVPWTSWRAAANHWPNAGGGTSTQAESSGQSVFAHEFSHLRGLPDNYNNPFARQRPQLHGLLGDDEPRHVQRPRRHPQPLADPERGRLGPRPAPPAALQEPARRPDGDRAGHARAEHLADQGIAVVPIKARESVPGARPRRAHGQLRHRRRPRRHLREPGLLGHPLLLPEPHRPATSTTGWRSSTRSATTRSRPATASCSRRAAAAARRRVWMIDPNPQDIGMIDFYRPDGTPGGGRPRRPAAAERRDLPRRHELGQRVRVRGHVQPAPLLRPEASTGTRTACSSTTSASGATTGAGPFARDLSLGSPSTGHRPASSPRARSR